MDVSNDYDHGPPEAAATGTSLRFATWNIHYGIGTDDRLDLHRISSVITALDADIVGLQEVGWHRSDHNRVDQFAYLRKATGYALVACPVRDPLRTHFGNALLTRLPVLDERWVDLKVLGHPPRAAVVVDLEGPFGPIRTAVAHFGLTPLERGIQAARLVEAMDGGGVPCVVLGDFNILQDWSRASRVLSQRFPRCVAEQTFPSAHPVLPLDRIYLSAEWTVQASRVISTGLARRASDHLPLVAEAVVTVAGGSALSSDHHRHAPAAT